MIGKGFFNTIKMASKRIAGVSIKESNLPTEDVIIKMALNTEAYRYKRDAVKLIKAEIKASGLYKAVKPKSKSTKRRKSSAEGVSEQRELDKGND